MKKKIYTYLLVLLSAGVSGQDGVGINTGTSLADPSAMLEVKSTSKGLLIPRIALASRPAANAVPAGLMIYNTTDKVFNYSNGTVWITFPVAYISQIQDKDLDTWVSAEKNSDEDILRFATGQSGSSVEVAQITKTGINVNYNSGSEYLLASNRVVAQNKTSHTIAAGAGSFPNIESSVFANAIIGSSALSTSSAAAGSNVVAGSGAGSVLSSTNNTIIGYNASKSITTGRENTVIGANAHGSTVLGNANTILGKGAGALSTNDSLILIGKDAGSTLSTGRNNIIVGTNIQAPTATTNNVITLGTAIKADVSTKKVTFHNLYTFPGVAGANGDLLVLDASNQLQWGGRLPRQVAGAMADIKPFDYGMATTNTALGTNAYFMKLTSYATAELATITTRIISNTSATAATIELGIYDAAGSRIGLVSTSVSAGATGSITLNFPTQVSVTSGQTLYLAIYCSNTTDIKFPNISSTNVPAYIYATATGLPASVAVPLTSNPNNIFINAY